MLEPFRINSEKEVFAIPNRLSVIEASLTTPENKEVAWHCMKMRHIAVVLATTDAGEVYLKKEWRLNRQDFVWELPSGFVENENPTDEEISDTANRELQEEAGVRAGKLDKLLSYYPHNHMRTQAHLFLATQLEKSELSHDEHEFVEIKILPFDEAFALALEDQIPNAQTALAFLLAKSRV